MNYQPGDCFTLEKFYIKDVGKGICLHALAAMLTFLTPLLKGISPKTLGIGKEDDTGYVQCPDPTYTCGGTVIFELTRDTN